MIRKRIGNDIRIDWELELASGQPEDLTTAIEIQVEVRHARSGSRYPQQFEIIGVNTIKLDFIASEQMKTGVYDLFVSYTKADPSIEGGIATFTRDKCEVFELVAKSCQLPTENQDISIITVIEKGDRGDDGITPHIGNNGNWYYGDEDSGVRAIPDDIINVVDVLPETGTPGQFYATFEN